MSKKTRITIEGNEQIDRGKTSDGQPFEERFQQAYLHEEGKRFPTSCRVRLFDNARAFQPGDYDTEQSVQISKYGRLEVVRDLELTPAPAAK
jgi:hypothetical protein